MNNVHIGVGNRSVERWDTDGDDGKHFYGSTWIKKQKAGGFRYQYIQANENFYLIRTLLPPLEKSEETGESVKDEKSRMRLQWTKMAGSLYVVPLTAARLKHQDRERSKKNKRKEREGGDCKDMWVEKPPTPDIVKVLTLTLATSGGKCCTVVQSTSRGVTVPQTCNNLWTKNEDSWLPARTPEETDLEEGEVGTLVEQVEELTRLLYNDLEICQVGPYITSRGPHDLDWVHRQPL
ncbi:hypothetical protein K503DRAFT_857226 [Rhizopogon vinicolor AM-OR11-026]|uniref:Uncharacterized protein n=1 Tax=Rhizopogon vinicolor AM-OR11-026 TaxID=1314800 RepID=A0A1B7MYJ2_9AGAM|nr:hypothetical protein K503DRAFT_857226 [Rhizopogon vinicolor AM-OR11-026]